MSTETKPDREQFKRSLRLARERGWRVPNPDEDTHGPAAWLRYWWDLEVNERLRAINPRARLGRPVPPHTVGSRRPEDVLQRAERINRNRKLWEGYL